jgi:hypothetical protein
MIHWPSLRDDPESHWKQRKGKYARDVQAAPCEVAVALDFISRGDPWWPAAARDRR